MATITISDVAHMAGVSIKTVSRVLNREPNVADATRAKVDQAVKALNYRPNISARSLAIGCGGVPAGATMHHQLVAS